MTNCPSDSEEEKLRLDMLIYGQCFQKDDKRIDPKKVYVAKEDPSILRNPNLSVFERWPKLVELEKIYNNRICNVPYKDAKEAYKLCLELAFYIQQKELM